MQSAETMTPAEGLLWLASLEKKCPLTEGAVSFPFCESHCLCEHHKPWRCKLCGGTGKVPVLPELRKPCPNFNAVENYVQGRGWTFISCTAREDYCRSGQDACQGRGWLPKQGRDALFMAMEKDGWSYCVDQHGGNRWVYFYRRNDSAHSIHGQASDDDLAAVKAMKAAGY